MQSAARIAATAFFLCSATAMAHAQEIATVPPISTPEVIDGQHVEQSDARSDFKKQWDAFVENTDVFTKEFADLTNQLGDVAQSTPESTKEKIAQARTKIVAFGSMFQPNSPLVQSLDAFSAWITANMARVNTLRGTLGNEKVERMIEGYKSLQAKATKAREIIDGMNTQIEGFLRELTVNEMEIAEWLLLQDANSALDNLLALLGKTKKSFEDMGNVLKSLRPAGV